MNFGLGVEIDFKTIPTKLLLVGRAVFIQINLNKFGKCRFRKLSFYVYEMLLCRTFCKLQFFGMYK